MGRGGVQWSVPERLHRVLLSQTWCSVAGSPPPFFVSGGLPYFASQLEEEFIYP